MDFFVDISQMNSKLYAYYERERTTISVGILEFFYATTLEYHGTVMRHVSHFAFQNKVITEFITANNFGIVFSYFHFVDDFTDDATNLFILKAFFRRWHRLE